jgi:hypothetical protein
MQVQGWGKLVHFEIKEEVWLDGRNLPILGHRKFSLHWYAPMNQAKNHRLGIKA